MTCAERPPRIRTVTSRHRGGRAAVTPAGGRTGVPEPAYATIHSGWVLRQDGCSRPTSRRSCLSWRDGEARPPRRYDGHADWPRPCPPCRTTMRRGATPMPRCMIRRDNRFGRAPETVPAACGSAVFRRHPGGLGQEPHAATQGTPPTAGWVSCPIPRTRWGVDGRADGMGTARPRIRCAGHASYSHSGTQRFAAS